VDWDGADGERIAGSVARLAGLRLAKLDYESPITGSLGAYVVAEYGKPVVTVEVDSPVLDEKLRLGLLSALSF
jgi:hypothetical protein